VKKNTTTALSIPTAAIQPKPTKTEIVEAMLVRAKLKHDAENERRKAKREALGKKIEALAIKVAKTLTPKVYIYAYADESRSHCELRVDPIKSPELDALLAEYHENALIRWDEKATREAIRRELTGAAKPGPGRLLENPEAVQAIDAMLEQWGY
jgi:hypothetical protein